MVRLGGDQVEVLVQKPPANPRNLVARQLGMRHWTEYPGIPLNAPVEEHLPKSRCRRDGLGHGIDRIHPRG
jgi:hypothetical protein